MLLKVVDANMVTFVALVQSALTSLMQRFEASHRQSAAATAASGALQAPLGPGTWARQEKPGLLTDA
jgi:hypothetical protein